MHRSPLLVPAHLLLAAALAAAVLVAPTASAVPAPEAALPGVTQVDAGRYHTCARLQNGQVRCWGDKGIS